MTLSLLIHLLVTGFFGVVIALTLTVLAGLNLVEYYPQTHRRMKSMVKHTCVFLTLCGAILAFAILVLCSVHL